MLRNALGVGWVSDFTGKKHYEGVQFNVIRITRGRVGVKCTGKKHYITLASSLVNPLAKLHIKVICFGEGSV